GTSRSPVPDGERYPPPRRHAVVVHRRGRERIHRSTPVRDLGAPVGQSKALFLRCELQPGKAALEVQTYLAEESIALRSSSRVGPLGVQRSFSRVCTLEAVMFADANIANQPKWSSASPCGIETAARPRPVATVWAMSRAAIPSSATAW